MMSSAEIQSGVEPPVPGGGGGESVTPAPPETTVAADLAYVSRITSGDEAALADFVTTYRRRLLGPAYRHAPDEAEDLVQITLMNTLSGLHRGLYQGKAPLAHYVQRIFTNAVKDHKRRRRREQGTMPLDDHAHRVADGTRDADVFHRVYRREQRRLVRQLLGRLGRLCRDAILLRDIRGLPYSEVASILAVPEGTIARRLHDCRRRLFAVAEKMLGPGRRKGRAPTSLK